VVGSFLGWGETSRPALEILALVVRAAAKACFCCGSLGHIREDCPEATAKRAADAPAIPVPKRPKPAAQLPQKSKGKSKGKGQCGNGPPRAACHCARHHPPPPPCTCFHAGYAWLGSKQCKGGAGGASPTERVCHLGGALWWGSSRGWRPQEYT